MDTATNNGLRDHLKLTAEVAERCRNVLKGYKYQSAHSFILENGRVFKRDPFTPEEMEILKDVLPRVAKLNPKVKECYRNAYLVAEAGARHGIKYAEGFALDIIPVAHAWASLNGKVVDVTWRKCGDMRRSTFKTVMSRVLANLKNEYIGITVPLDYIQKRVLETKRWISVLDDYMGQWPLFKSDFKLWDQEL